MTDSTLDEVVEEARDACLSAAARAYEDAGMQGLCAEGRWEAAVEAIREVDLRPLINGRGRTGDRSR